ncbi:MAG: phage coat protein [Clostridia bacterium]|nr:phage coat protein [Clostridia bacterium]MBQ6121738.1 phage coat protein [Clostridia bacterium]
MSVFDSKNFNAEVFGKYLETVPRVKQNALLKAGILRGRPDLKTMLVEQTGGNFISVPMTGLIGGAALNYDGNTDITATQLETFLQSMIVVGRAKAWQEKDFSQDITGHDFMADIAAQVADYWDDVDQATLLAILEGVFGVTTNSFNTDHTLDITAETVPTVGAGTLNSAIQKAAGANKDIFTCVVMHSVVATNLENLQLLEYLKYNDGNGVERDLSLATWNGRTVLVDDDVPVEAVAATQTETAYNKYTTYVLGTGAFDYCDCGAAVPNEVYRQPLTKGGQEYLITRQRKLFAPRGFSFVQPNTPIVSPTDANLETAARWALVRDSAGTGYFDSKAIPLARIISRG